MLCGRPPPFVSVYVLGSRVSLFGGMFCSVCGLVNGGAEGGGGAIGAVGAEGGSDGRGGGADGAGGAVNFGGEGGVVGGGGGGGAAGDVCPLPKAFLAACMAKEGVEGPFEEGKDIGGGGGVDRLDGTLDAVDGSGGGAGGAGADDGGGGGGGGGGAGAAVEGLRDATGGGGGFEPAGGGGGARGGVTSGEDCAERIEKADPGLGTGFGGGLRRFETRGFVGWGGEDSADFGTGRRAGNFGAVGGLGAEVGGGRGAELRDVSGSDIYDESRFAPVSIPPPRFFSLGIPPANMPPS